MGIIRRGILGGFSNKVGNIVGSTWKGIAVIKSLPLSVANPRTAGQVKQRQRFSKLTVVASLLLSSIIKPLWDRFATGMSGYNAFISANRDAFQNNNWIDDQKIVMSRGRILAPVITLAQVTGSNLVVTIANPTFDRFGLPTDRIYVVGCDSQLTAFPAAQISNTSRGANPTVQVTVPITSAGSAGNIEVVYAGYLRADGSEVSTSTVYTM